MQVTVRTGPWPGCHLPAPAWPWTVESREEEGPWVPAVSMSQRARGGKAGGPHTEELTALDRGAPVASHCQRHAEPGLRLCFLQIPQFRDLSPGWHVSGHNSLALPSSLCGEKRGRYLGRRGATCLFCEDRVARELGEVQELEVQRPKLSQDAAAARGGPAPVPPENIGAAAVTLLARWLLGVGSPPAWLTPRWEFSLPDPRESSLAPFCPPSWLGEVTC